MSQVAVFRLLAMLGLLLAPPAFAAPASPQAAAPAAAVSAVSVAAPAAPASTKAAALAGTPSDAELHAIKQATAGAVLAEVALRCHWQTDEAFIAKAKGMALVIAVADVTPASRQLAVMVRILESQNMTHHRDVAAGRVTAGACASIQTRALWTDLEHLTVARTGADAGAGAQAHAPTPVAPTPVAPTPVAPTPGAPAPAAPVAAPPPPASRP